MAETDSKYADSFISQDDLDTLMKEADDLGPEAFERTGTPPSGDGGAADSEPPDDVINQDDIDKLLGLSGSDESGAEESDIVSQEDIDALLEGGAAPETPDASVDTDSESSDLDLITQDDINALLSGVELNGGDAEEPGSDDADDDSLITQDDIDALLAGADTSGADTGDSDLKTEEDDDDSALISQDDIDALLAGGDQSNATEALEDQGGDDSSLISQDDIDALLAGNTNGSGDEEISAYDTDNQVPKEDIDRLLEGGPDSGADSDVSEDISDAAEENLISQEDIDNLLGGHDVEPEEESGETLITQEDIDRLLNSPEPDTGGVAEELGEDDKLVSQEDIDRLLNADIDELESSEVSEASEPPDQVILEKGDEPEEKGRPGKAWYKSKVVISCSAAFFVMMITGVVWVFLSGTREEPPPVTEVTEVVEEVDAVAPEAEPEIDEELYPAEEKIITVTMEDFVVPSPAKVKGAAYISVTITLEIADVSSNPIKDYEPFFRNIVYEVLNKALILQTEAKIVEADLKRMILEALNDALSEGAVANIEFSDFSLG